MMQSFLIGALVVLACSVWVNGLDLDQPLTLVEQQRMADTLRSQLNSQSLATVFSAVLGLSALKKDVPDPKAVCSSVDKLVKEDNLCSLYKAASVYNALSCKPKNDKLFAAVASHITDDANVETVAKAITALSLSGQKVSNEQVAALSKAFQRDDSPASLGWALAAASLLQGSADIKAIESAVEDVLQQADEIDGKMMQFEGGLEITSRVVAGIFKLAKQRKSAPALTEDQTLKFAMYFLSRKYVFSAKDINNVVSVLSLLADNQFFVPLVVSQFQSTIVNEQRSAIKVRVTTVMDKSIEDVSVVAGPVANVNGETLFSNKALTKGPKDDSIILESEVARGHVAAFSHVLEITSSDPPRGVYTATLSVKVNNKEKKNYITVSDAEVTFKVVSRVTVEDVELSIMDREQTSSSKSMSLKFPNKVGKQLDADHHQKIVMKFGLREATTGDLVTAHQAFIRLTHVETGQEIFFVAEPESDNVYRFVLDLGQTAKDSFGNLSGKYSMDLIIGDAAIQIPIRWNMASIKLSFAAKSEKTKKQARITGPQPVIEHVFRTPDKRPALIISNAFTALIGAPVLIMFAMWIKIGANVSNLGFSPSALIFHVGLAAIFALYYCFWTHLNMFQTLKYLAMIGGVTFLFGNKMLADIATRRQNRT